MATVAAPSDRKRARGRRLRGALLLVMGCLAVASPFFAGTLALALVGVLLIVCGTLEMNETFHAHDEAGRRSAYLSGVLSIVAGVVLLTRAELVLRGLALLLAASFFIDGIGKTVAAVRARTRGSAWKWSLASGLINAALAVVLTTRWPVSGQAIVVVLVAIRMFAAGWSLLLHAADTPTPEPPPDELHPDRALRLPPRPEFAAFEKSFQAEAERRRVIDAAWTWTFIAVFFAIHIGRMNVAWNFTGMIAPLIAVVGDVGTALILAFGIILPVRLAWRRLTRPLERRAWMRLLARSNQGRGPGLLGKPCRVWLMTRMRFSRRLAGMRWSPVAALRWGLQVGLPATAILIAVNPIWGFSWFFNSESWTAGIWDRWAGARTFLWREKMIEAVRALYPSGVGLDDRLFAVQPEGVAGGADFSFLVLGDTGEGGAAQHSLRDQYLTLGRRPDVKFLVISSDVIYPDGAMEDYEPNFYLPFKGVTQPIYALPGNHDWYDALEAFAANFLEPDAARASMLARMKMDGWWTTTTAAHIDAKIHEAARLRSEYGVSTGWQRGPFFEIQAERFALIAVDTGVLKRVDTDQWAWLNAALERARGKFIMAILGHPLYAGGRYQGGHEDAMAGEWVAHASPTQVIGQHLGPDAAPFAAVHQLLRDHQVQVVMAGDTHDFEYYREPYEADGVTRTMHHFVNGGGGAYLSIGTALDWPNQTALPDCAYYPRKDALIEKLDRETPAWKAPLWSWVKHLRAWPLTAESVAGAFLYNRTPYFQSFVEIRVENAQDQVRLIPHGTRGPLRWGELQRFGAVRPQGKADDDPVEFVVPMHPRRP